MQQVKRFDARLWWLRFRMARQKTQERLALAIAYRLPHWVVYWALIRAGSDAIRRDEIVPDVRFTEVLQRWSEKGPTCSR